MKNNSVTNNFVIFGLALAFLFLSSCGKKEDSNEIKLPFETKQVKKVTQKSPPKKLPKLQKQKSENTRPVIIKVYENDFPSKNATVKIKKPTTKSARKLSWWTAETDEDGNAEISVPAYWKNLNVVAQKDNYALVTFSTNNLTPENSPINVELNLDEQGVIITAELITNKKINDESEDVFAKITSDRRNDRESLFAANSTSCFNNRIIFHPIKIGLKRMKILVDVGDFAKSYSDYFDTLDGTNKTIQVNLFPSVKLYGRAVRTDGMSITNIHVTAIPYGLYKNSPDIGHVNKKIKTDSDGNFVINKLLPEHYKLHITADEGDYMVTNVVLYSDEENKMEFIFPNIEYRTIKGIVKYEETDDPAEGIDIKCENSRNKNNNSTIKTDENGEFICQLPMQQHGFYVLKINEPGYAIIEQRVRSYRYKGEQIKLFLRETGIITGKITNKKGEPISEITVEFLPISKQHENWEDGQEYPARSAFPSNEEGMYVISNAAAPEVFKLLQAHGNNDYFLPDDYTKKRIKVDPGETVTFDFTMWPKQKIKVKLFDENENAILRYKLHIRAKYQNSESGTTIDVNLDDENEWYNASIWNKNRKATLSLNAEDEDGRYAVTNNINIKADKTYEIILKTGKELSPDVAGFIYNYDMTPAIDKWVIAFANSKSDNTASDHLGSFQIMGLGAEKGASIQLEVHKDRIIHTTNVLAGSDNIEWILSEPLNITGRVFIENLNTVASNFMVSVGSQHNKRSFSSEEGKFSFPDNSEKSYFKKSFKVYIYVDGYAPEEREVNPNDRNSFDIGDIIMMTEAATVSGRVIDKENNPISIDVVLMKGKWEKISKTKSKESDGTFEFTDVPPGKYYVVAHNKLTFVKSDNFEIGSEENYILPDLVIESTSDTEEISGTVTLDGLPLGNGKLSFLSGNFHNETKIIDGKYKVKLLPGRYTVFCIKRKVTTIAELEESGENIINFKSGTGTFEFELPHEGKWKISLFKEISHINVPIAIPIRVYNNKSEKSSNIQDGEYIITAYCSDEANKTNITVKSTIKSGETKKIRF